LWVDVQELARATPADPDALDLFDGPLMEDLGGLDPAFDRWLVEERRAVVRRAVALAEAVLAEQNEPGAIVATAERLLAIERSHEGAWRALMQANLRRGERAAVIEAYERCNRLRKIAWKWWFRFLWLVRNRHFWGSFGVRTGNSLCFPANSRLRNRFRA